MNNATPDRRAWSVPFARPALLAAATALGLVFACGAWAGPFAPGTGVREEHVGDDFENTGWTYIPNNPKCSQELEGGAGYRPPAGISFNRRWIESTYRGHPDYIARIATPAGGVPGSAGAMLMRTLNSGRLIPPGAPTYTVQQDDFMTDTTWLERQIVYTSGATTNWAHVVPVSCRPSVLVRIYLPPFSQFPQQLEQHDVFALRTQMYSQGSSGPNYWPGIWLRYYRPGGAVYFRIRAAENGSDYYVTSTTTPGWYTLGMSFSEDGMVHYYAAGGVGALTETNRLASHRPYGLSAAFLNEFYFCVTSPDDGVTWSADWIVDDMFLYSADTDGDGIPDRWENLYFPSLTNASAATDADGDGATDLAEYRARTDPTNAASVFRITDATAVDGGGCAVRWQGVTNKLYSLGVADDLTGPWTAIATNLQCLQPTLSHTDSVHRAGANFYRINMDE